jgi:hypothetical protein
LRGVPGPWAGIWWRRWIVSVIRARIARGTVVRIIVRIGNIAIWKWVVPPPVRPPKSKPETPSVSVTRIAPISATPTVIASAIPVIAATAITAVVAAAPIARVASAVKSSYTAAVESASVKPSTAMATALGKGGQRTVGTAGLERNDATGGSFL